MDIRSSDIVKYRSSYWEYLKFSTSEIIKIPFRHGKEIIEASIVILVLMMYVLIILTAPISFPICAFIRMKITKTEIEKRYTKEELEKAKEIVH